MAHGFKSYLAITEEWGTLFGTSQWGNEYLGTRANETLRGIYFTSESFQDTTERELIPELGGSGADGDRSFRNHRMLGRKAEGDVEFAAFRNDPVLGLLLKHTFGKVLSRSTVGLGKAINTAGAWTQCYQHKLYPSDYMYDGTGVGELQGYCIGTVQGNQATSECEGTAGYAWGLQFHEGIEQGAGGGVKNYGFRGMRVKNMEMNVVPGKPVTFKFGFMGKQGAGTRPSLASSMTYVTIASSTPWYWSDLTTVIANGTRNLDSFKLVYDENADHAWMTGQTDKTIGRFAPNGLYTIDVSFSAPFAPWMQTEVHKARSGTTTRIVAQLKNGTSRLTLTMPKVFYDQADPQPGGNERIIHTMNGHVEFQGTGANWLGAAIEAIYVSTDKWLGIYNYGTILPGN